MCLSAHASPSATRYLSAVGEITPLSVQSILISVGFPPSCEQVRAVLNTANKAALTSLFSRLDATNVRWPRLLHLLWRLPCHAQTDLRCSPQKERFTLLKLKWGHVLNARHADCANHDGMPHTDGSGWMLRQLKSHVGRS